MLRSRKLAVWLSVCWLSLCLCENEVDKGCYGDFIFDNVSNSCVPVVENGNSTESTTTHVPERFSFISRLQSVYNTSEENLTVSVNFPDIAYDMVENLTQVVNLTEIAARNVVEVVNVTVEELNSTFSQINGSKLENFFNSTSIGRVLDAFNETSNETEVISRILRNADYVAENNSTEITNMTEVQVSQRNIVEEFNSTGSNDMNSTETQTRISRQILNGCRGAGSCVNGFCDKFTDTLLCICTPSYQGESCDTLISNNSTYQQILNKTFCLEKFLNESFSNTSVAFDELMINLVDRIWSEVNSEEQYIHIFDFKNITKYANVGIELQKLQVYSSISLYNFENRLSLYEQVLNNLIDYFSNTSMKQQAINFVKEWEKSTNKTINRQVANESFVEKVRCLLNETYYLSHEMVVNYEKQIVIGEAVRFGDMDRIVNSTDKSWVQVVEYGFWHVTKQLSNEVQANENQKQNGKRSLPQGIYKVFSRINSNYLFKYVLKPNLNGQTLAAVLKLISSF